MKKTIFFLTPIIISILLLNSCSTKISSIDQAKSESVGTWKGYEYGDPSISSTKFKVKYEINNDGSFNYWEDVLGNGWEKNKTGTYDIEEGKYSDTQEAYYYLNLSYDSMGETFHINLVFKNSSTLRIAVSGIYYGEISK